MRCALVHDWLTGMRGGEKVLEVLCEVLPGSDLYTLVHVPGSVAPVIEGRRIAASWLNRLPRVRSYYRYLLPLMPSAARQLKLDGYDLVVAVSHCVAHGVDVSGGARFVSYCLTPMRYAWDVGGSYFTGRGRLDPRRWALRWVGGRLRDWDRRAAGRVTEFVTDCRNVQERVKHCYGRDSAIIHPPVDTDYFAPVDEPSANFYLWVGALAPYKRIDLALGAFRKLDRKLVVIGAGQDYAWARRAAPPNVEFLGWQPDEVLRRYYSTCRALIFPGEEDFGIVPLEAQACGRPVIAYEKGGALETVIGLGRSASPTGVFFEEPAADGLVDAVRRFEQNQDVFDPDAARSQALSFSRDRCKAAFCECLFGKVGK